jgi:hypothetical protein
VHTQEVLTAIQTVPSTVVDAETAARSYLTSADEKAWKHCDAANRGQSRPAGDRVREPRWSITETLADAGHTVIEAEDGREDALRRRPQEAVAGVSESCRVESAMTHGRYWRQAQSPTR